jgi:hypothetical protein
MLKTFLAASCALSLVACVKQDDASDIARVLPTADQVSIKLKDNASAARVSQQDVIGQTAGWYVATRDVTRLFNGGSAWVLTLIHTIVKFPVTSTSGNRSTWGPWNDGPLSPAEYKLDVTAVGDGTYTYQLSGRSLTQAGAQFEVVIDGKADPRAGDAKGSGEFLIDFEAGKRVNPIDARNDKGSVAARYDLTARHLDLTIMSTDALGRPVDADYAYNETAEGGGNMTFAINTNLGGGAANEQIALRSRWLNTGAGRADARLAGGDLGTLQATASECWDAGFRETYYTDSVNFLPTVGAVSACVFATADLPAVQ